METHEYGFVVRSFECGAEGGLQLCSLMGHLQEAAARHAEQLGFGRSMLVENSGYWVLSNFLIEVQRACGWGDELLVRTWPSGGRRVVATREFAGLDGDGRKLFRATSEWMVLGVKSGRPKNLWKLGLRELGEAERVFADKIERLAVDEDFEAVWSIRVGHSSIDVNGHVNNAEYVRWGLDALRAAGFCEQVRRMQITYLAEIRKGDDLEVGVRENDSGIRRVAGRKTENGDVAFVMDVFAEKDN